MGTGDILVVSDLGVHPPGLFQIELGLVLLGITDEHGHLRRTDRFTAREVGSAHLD
jgi:hypothetical protein